MIALSFMYLHLMSNVQGFYFFFAVCILLFLTLKLLMTSWRYGMGPLRAVYYLKNGAAQLFQRIFTALSTHWHYSLTVTSSSANQASPSSFQVCKYFCISISIIIYYICMYYPYTLDFFFFSHFTASSLFAKRLYYFNSTCLCRKYN